MKTVLTPAFWDEHGKRYQGQTDGVDTYCCSAVPAWFVRIPSLDYEGYFNVSDLTVVRREEVKSQ